MHRRRFSVADVFDNDAGTSEMCSDFESAAERLDVAAQVAHMHVESFSSFANAGWPMPSDAATSSCERSHALRSSSDVIASRNPRSLRRHARPAFR
jgi:hypothetical protein